MSSSEFDPKFQEYVHPEVLVTTEWVSQHLDDARVRVVEADEDILLYEVGHIPGAIKLDWHTDLQDAMRRDFIDKSAFERLLSQLGIENDTIVVLYGDKNNWYATYAFWLFKMYGHGDIRVMDGGRLKWEQENRAWSREIPSYGVSAYSAHDPDPSIRAYRQDVERQLDQHQPLIDVRSPKEYSGELLHMVDYPQEGAQRGGHIPSAKNIPWGTAANPEDGTFRPRAELTEIYEERNGLSREQQVISYCRIGERSSHTWFVLKYLLGYDDVRNYDGSWTEWGNLVGVPIEK